MNKGLEILELRLKEQEILGKESISFKDLNKIVSDIKSLVISDGDGDTNDIYKTPETFFKSVMDRITEIKEDEYRKYYMINGDLYLEYYKKSDYCYFRNNGFWAVFEEIFNLSYGEICNLTKIMLEEYFKSVKCSASM